MHSNLKKGESWTEQRSLPNNCLLVTMLTGMLVSTGWPLVGLINEDNLPRLVIKWEPVPYYKCGKTHLPIEQKI